MVWMFLDPCTFSSPRCTREMHLTHQISSLFSVQFRTLSLKQDHLADRMPQFQRRFRSGIAACAWIQMQTWELDRHRKHILIFRKHPKHASNCQIWGWLSSQEIFPIHSRGETAIIVARQPVQSEASYQWPSKSTLNVLSKPVLRSRLGIWCCDHFGEPLLLSCWPSQLATGQALHRWSRLCNFQLPATRKTHRTPPQLKCMQFVKSVRNGNNKWLTNTHTQEEQRERGGNKCMQKFKFCLNLHARCSSWCYNWQWIAGSWPC